MSASGVAMVTLVTAVSSLLGHLVLKFVLHPERMRLKTEELKAYRLERDAATKLKDQKLLKKLDKQKVYMSKVEQEVSSFQLKTMLVNMGIMFSAFYFLWFTIPMGDVAGRFSASLYGGNEEIQLSYGLWYFIALSFFIQVFRKAFGVGG
ncbi:MAG: EMC3/TMCO1 family protein [Thermoproteota archaeon]